jgi:hypothetical protein
MRKLIIATCMMVATLMLNAQSWNPYVNQGIIASAPLYPAELNGQGEISFQIGNTGSNPMEYSPDLPENNLKVIVTLQNGVPAKNNPLSAIGGSWKDFFRWSYDKASNVLTGIQQTTIPPYSQGNITVGYVVETNSSLTAPANGFEAELIAPAYVGNRNHTEDDKVSSRTYTRAYDFGDAPESYGSARHEINLNKNPSSGQYTRYIYLGDLVDAEMEPFSSPEADGDNLDNVNDEDGVVFPDLTAGKTALIPVKVTVHGESWGVLNAWFDWNGDGDFADAGEKVAGTPMMISSSGTYTLEVDVPEDAITGRPTFARFRIGQNVGFSAPAAWGEAEDYMILINAAEKIADQPEPEKELDVRIFYRNEVTLQGTREGSDIILTWNMRSEFETDRFLVERSTDGSNFIPIGDYIVAAGNQTRRSGYSYKDSGVTSEVAIYRIRLIEKSQSYVLSNEHMEILDNFAGLDISIYPVPVRDWYNVSINTPGNYHLELFDASGRIMYQTPMDVVSGSGEVKRLSRSGFTGGQYFMRVTDKNKGYYKTVKLTFLQ